MRKNYICIYLLGTNADYYKSNMQDGAKLSKRKEWYVLKNIVKNPFYFPLLYYLILLFLLYF